MNFDEDTYTFTIDSNIVCSVLADPWFAAAASDPSIDIPKHTLDKGIADGDRNEFAEALVLTPEQAADGVKVAFVVTNTGDELLSNLIVEDATRDSATGTVQDTLCDLVINVVDAEPSEAVTIEVDGTSYNQRPFSAVLGLKAGQKILLVGMLTGVEAGPAHTDMISVTAEGTYSGVKVSDSRPWNASLLGSPLALTGAVTGILIVADGVNVWLAGSATALLLAAAAAAYGLHRRIRTMEPESGTETSTKVASAQG